MKPNNPVSPSALSSQPTEISSLIATLKAAAEAAGGSKWKFNDHMYVSDDKGLMVADVRGFGRGMDEKFATHICAASPENILKLLASVAPSGAAEDAWIDATKELPPENKNHCWLAWITSQNKNGGYIDLVSYGDYVCQNDDCRPGDLNYIEDHDDGNMRGSGWYREEETHGGEFDYIFVNLNGKITHWMPLPAAPPVANPVAPPLPDSAKEPDV